MPVAQNAIRLYMNIGLQVAKIVQPQKSHVVDKFDTVLSLSSNNRIPN